MQKHLRRAIRAREMALWVEVPAAQVQGPEFKSLQSMLKLDRLGEHLQSQGPNGKVGVKDRRISRSQSGIGRKRKRPCLKQDRTQGPIPVVVL